MKFKFCGDLDAPDWILAEVTVLSRMSSIRMKVICRLVISQLLGNQLNYEELRRATVSPRLNLSSSDIKALVAALHFILSNSAKHDVDDEVLPIELQQLGLPMDVCKAIVKTYSAAREQLRSHFATLTLSLPRITKTDWRVDYILASSHSSNVSLPSVRLNFTLNKAASVEGYQLSFELTADKFRVLYNEMRAARAAMAIALGETRSS